MSVSLNQISKKKNNRQKNQKSQEAKSFEKKHKPWENSELTSTVKKNAANTESQPSTNAPGKNHQINREQNTQDVEPRSVLGGALSWVQSIQVKPKLKIPVPRIFTFQEKQRRNKK